MAIKRKGRAMGSAFYEKKGLVAITIHVPKDVREKLKALAKKEERSVYVTARRILEDRLSNES